MHKVLNREINYFTETDKRSTLADQQTKSVLNAFEKSASGL